MHRATNRFWRCFNALSGDIQRLARENFALVRRDPRHPSLHFKKVGNFWSARVGLAYRALAVEDDAGFTWVWIGTHDDYELIIRS
ncbi:MAG: hypothetical protein K8T91_09535 [Planctomycetes bacterium]|nr:hypothetical protein [Planctomycetota bacterium]